MSNQQMDGTLKELQSSGILAGFCQENRGEKICTFRMPNVCREPKELTAPNVDEFEEKTCIGNLSIWRIGKRVKVQSGPFSGAVMRLELPYWADSSTVVSRSTIKNNRNDQSSAQ